MRPRNREFVHTCVHLARAHILQIQYIDIQGTSRAPDEDTPQSFSDEMKFGFNERKERKRKREATATGISRISDEVFLAASYLRPIKSNV